VAGSPQPLLAATDPSPSPAAKVDLLSQTLKLSDLDFDSFGDPEPSLIEPQTQELKLEDLKHLASEPSNLSIPGASRPEKDSGEDLRDLLEFSTFPFIEPASSGQRGGGNDLFFNQAQPFPSSSGSGSSGFNYQEVLDQGFQGPGGLDFGLPFGTGGGNGDRKGKQQQQQQQQQQPPWWP